MKRVLVISSAISAAHFLEDFSLFLIGRYTEVHFGFVFIGVILLGLVLGVLSSHPKIKKFLAE